MKRCPGCGHTKPLNEFHRNRARKDGRHVIFVLRDDGSAFKVVEPIEDHLKLIDLVSELYALALRCEQAARYLSEGKN